MVRGEDFSGGSSVPAGDCREGGIRAGNLLPRAGIDGTEDRERIAPAVNCPLCQGHFMKWGVLFFRHPPSLATLILDTKTEGLSPVGQSTQKVSRFLDTFSHTPRYSTCLGDSLYGEGPALAPSSSGFRAIAGRAGTFEISSGYSPVVIKW